MISVIKFFIAKTKVYHGSETKKSKNLIKSNSFGGETEYKSNQLLAQFLVL